MMRLNHFKELMLLIPFAFVIAIAIAAKVEQVSSKTEKGELISCIPVNADREPTLNENERYKNRPVNNDNHKGDGNSCPHQQPGAGVLCNLSFGKNRFSKVPAC